MSGWWRVKPNKTQMPSNNMKRYRYAPKSFSLLECLMCELKHVSSWWPECTWCVHTHLRTRHNGSLTNLTGGGGDKKFYGEHKRSFSRDATSQPYRYVWMHLLRSRCLRRNFLREIYHARRGAIFYGLFDLHGMNHAAFIRIKIFTVNQLLDYAERLI